MNERKNPALDNCEVCHGERGGVPGNENVVNGVIICDYCDYLQSNPQVEEELN